MMQEERGVPSGGLGQWMLRHPLFVAVLWVVAAYLVAQWMPELLLVLFTLLVILAFFPAFGIRRWVNALWLMVVAMAIGVGAWRNANEESKALQLLASAADEFEVIAVSDAVGDEGFWQVPARLADSGLRVWWQGRGEVPVEGSRIRAYGSFELAEEPRNPGEFDRRKWMEQQGLVAVFRQDPRQGGEVVTGSWSRAVAGARSGVRTRITNGIEAESVGAKVILAVVLGEKPRADQELLEDFRYSGSMHVFSVSGLHVGMVAVLVWMMAAYSGINRRWLALPVIALVFAYAWLTGANPPAIRAAWMASVFLGAFCLRRRPDLPNALGVVLLVLLIWDVRQLQQPSVQLSYGVVAAIAFGLPWTMRWFSRLGAAPIYMPVAEIKGPQLWWWRLRQWMAGTLAVSCAACMGAAPLTLWHFGLVTPVSVVAALLMLPLVFAVLALALMSVVLSPIQLATVPVNRINGCLAESCATVAGWMAKLPGGHWRVGQERGPVLWVYDLKNGDGAAVWLPDNHGAATLIDCGGRSSFRHPLNSSLDRLGIEPDSVVLTHPDGGHVGGGHAVWRELPIRQALMPVERARSPAYRSWLNEAPKGGVKLLQSSELQGLTMVGEARVEWLHLPNPQAQNLAADHRVLVMRLHWGKWRILWLSDAGAAEERAMLGSGRDLHADVIVAGRHRSDLSLTDDFIAAVKPRAIVIGNDSHPGGERYDSYQIQSWRDAGIMIFDQSECGAVSLRPEDEALVIEGFVDDSKLRLE